MDCDAGAVQIFGKPVVLQEEWQKIAGRLGSFCEGNRYIEYDKEIARLRAKLLHLQEEVDGFRAHNRNLSSMNQNLAEKVKDLISMQDSQLEQYSTALVLLTEERKELWQSLGSSQKKVRQLEKLVASCKCRNIACKSNEADSVASSQEAGCTEDTEEVINSLRVTGHTEEVASRIRDNDQDSAGDRCELVVPSVPHNTDSVVSFERHIESMESSFESKRSSESVKSTPQAKGAFVKSMIQKLEKTDSFKKKYKLDEESNPKRAEEHKDNRLSEVGGGNPSDDAESVTDSVPESLPESLPESSNSEDVESLKFQIAELEQEVMELRASCQSLTCMLERTYDEMQNSTLEQDDTKDQLIACLRARLLEAICDLMKVEKRDVKSIACGSSLPRVHKHPEPSAPPLELFSSKSDPIVSPSKSKALGMFASPKFKALREDNYNKLRKLSCWKPRGPDESA